MVEEEPIKRQIAVKGASALCRCCFPARLLVRPTSSRRPLLSPPSPPFPTHPTHPTHTHTRPCHRDCRRPLPQRLPTPLLAYHWSSGACSFFNNERQLYCPLGLATSLPHASCCCDCRSRAAAAQQNATATAIQAAAHSPADLSPGAGRPARPPATPCCACTARSARCVGSLHRSEGRHQPARGCTREHRFQARRNTGVGGVWVAWEGVSRSVGIALPETRDCFGTTCIYITG